MAAPNNENCVALAIVYVRAAAILDKSLRDFYAALARTWAEELGNAAFWTDIANAIEHGPARPGGYIAPGAPFEGAEEPLRRSGLSVSTATKNQLEEVFVEVAKLAKKRQQKSSGMLWILGAGLLYLATRKR